LLDAPIAEDLPEIWKATFSVVHRDRELWRKMRALSSAEKVDSLERCCSILAPIFEAMNRSTDEGYADYLEYLSEEEQTEPRPVIDRDELGAPLIACIEYITRCRETTFFKAEDGTVHELPSMQLPREYMPLLRDALLTYYALQILPHESSLGNCELVAS